ncbi:MAG TPA: MurT ligase domain-containing protein [Solirubrobacterales bacterium]|nr:MurT ligase domain-containing protein [Solirubrobacterales bacterium]
MSVAVAERRSAGAAFGAKQALARAIGAASRRSGRGGGTTLPGRVLLRLEPEAIAILAGQLSDGATIVSATNGKTTTAGMIAAILAAEGRPPVHNRAGSNMTWGVATALLEQRGAEGLFEVDEAWLPRVAAQLNPRLIVLGNLFRDQLDRYGEMEALAEEWAKAVAARPAGTGLALNADDPLIADLGRDPDSERPREGVLYFGIEDHRQALPELQHAFDAKHCRRCGHPYVYEVAFVGHLGHYSCPNCAAERPRPEVAATRIELRGMEGSTVTVRVPGGEIEVELPLPGLYNVYNALAAIAATLRLGVAPERIAAALAGMRAAFGRVETIEVGDAQVSILLIKNPAGANEVLRTLKLEAERPPAPTLSSQKPSDSDQNCELPRGGGELVGGIDLWIALNDRIADGRDVSWVWDADFELLAGAVRRVTCAGTRAPEMALRLKYAGWPEDRIAVEPGIATSLDAAVAAAQGRLFALPTYTALLELRRLLADRGLAKEFWR